MADSTKSGSRKIPLALQSVESLDRVNHAIANVSSTLQGLTYTEVRRVLDCVNALVFGSGRVQPPSVPVQLKKTGAQRKQATKTGKPKPSVRSVTRKDPLYLKLDAQRLAIVAELATIGPDHAKYAGLVAAHVQVLEQLKNFRAQTKQRLASTTAPSGDTDI